MLRLLVVALVVLLGTAHGMTTYTPTSCGLGGTYTPGLLDGRTFYIPFDGNLSAVTTAPSPVTAPLSPVTFTAHAATGTGAVELASTMTSSTNKVAAFLPGALGSELALSGTDEYTLSIWVRVVDFNIDATSISPSINADIPVYCSRDGVEFGSLKSGLCFMLRDVGGVFLVPRVTVGAEASPYVFDGSSSPSPAPGWTGWTHVVIGGTREASALTPRSFIYINGTQLVTTGTGYPDVGTETKFLFGQTHMYDVSFPPPPPSVPPKDVAWGDASVGYTAYSTNVHVDDFSMYSRVLTETEIMTLYTDRTAALTAQLGTCSCPAGTYVSASTGLCVQCDAVCATCSAGGSCDTCVAGYGPEPNCPFICDPKCDGCTEGSPAACTLCASGFENPPDCPVVCASQCASCTATSATSCTACAAGLVGLPTCTEAAPTPNPPAPESAGSSSNIAVYAGVGGAVLLVLILGIVFIIYRRSKNASVDFAALMCPPLKSDGWARMFPRWNEPMFAGFAAGVAYAPMEGVVGTEPLALPLYMAVADVVPKRVLYSAVVAAMATTQEHGLTIPLVKALISHEVSVTLSAETLFRQNSAATKLFQAWGKLRAVEYVRAVIGVLVLECLYQYNQVHGKRNKVNADGSVELDDGYGTTSQGLEVDPTRLTDADSLDVNKYKLMTTCQTFLESIYRSGARCPASLKEVLAYVGSAVGEAYPGKAVQGMGGFYFLRLFCPAITSPQEYLISREEVSRDERRYLVLVAKVIQNAANGVKFGKKEDFMVQLNDLVESNIPKIDNFFTNALFVGSDPEAATFSGPTDVAEPVPPLVRANALATLHTMVTEHSEDIIAWLDQHPMDGADVARMQVAAIMALPPPPAAATRT